MSAYATIDLAVQAVHSGARDFLQKPFAFDELRTRIEAALAGASPSPAAKIAPAVDRGDGLQGFVARSGAMRDVVDLARRVAPGRTTVLITGETGTGKELVAGLIHDSSDRRDGPFIKVNCAALPETLLESELFGHERGAFTGAERRRIGRFEQANGGTLFLDEIGDMTPTTQAKLLRVLQDQEFFRLGGTQTLRTDARIVAATNQDLKRAQAEGRFREDLYFRLDVIGLHLAPLRERPEDLEGLLETQVARLARELDRPVTGFDDAALRRLRSHAWPGNVRELRNVVERAVLMSAGPLIGEADLALETDLSDALEARGNDWTAPGVSLRSMERRLVLAALEEVGWVQKEAAGLIGVSPRKLNYMIRRMHITHPSWRRNRSSDASDHS
jgi:DNA-binding NtrC family response regulator